MYTVANSRIGQWFRWLFTVSDTGMEVFKILLGLELLVIPVTSLIFVARDISLSGWPAIAAIEMSVRVVVTLILVENGIGLIISNFSTPGVYRSAKGSIDVIVVPSSNDSSRLFHRQVTQVINPSKVVAGLEYAKGRLNKRSCIRILTQLIRQNPRATIYSAEIGAILVAEVLRQNPDIILDSWVIYEAPAAPEHVKRRLWLGMFYGGPISTMILKFIKMSSINWTSDTSTTAQAEFGRSITELSAPRVFGAMWLLATFKPIEPGELQGRARSVTLLKAPGDANTDLQTRAAAHAWYRAFAHGDAMVEHIMTSVRFEIVDVPAGTRPSLALHASKFRVVLAAVL